MTPDDGGPAFPSWDIGPVGSEGTEGTVPVHGMSLRDAFALGALSGVMHDRAIWNCTPGEEVDVARRLYRWADAMLRARTGDPS